MAITATEFKERLFAAPEVVDPGGVHSEFAAGGHGRKVNFDGIPVDTDLFKDWVDITAHDVRQLLGDRGLRRLGTNSLSGAVLLSVANGTNRLVGPVAEKVGFGLLHMLTEKVDGVVRLGEEAAEEMRLLVPQFVLACEDVGTTGTSSSGAVSSARKAGAEWIEVLNSAQRRLQLPKLDALGVAYQATIMVDDLPTYTPEECQKSGYCADGWQLIKREK